MSRIIPISHKTKIFPDPVPHRAQKAPKGAPEGPPDPFGDHFGRQSAGKAGQASPSSRSRFTISTAPRAQS